MEVSCKFVTMDFFPSCLDHLLNNVIFVSNHKLLKLGKRRD